MEKGIFFFLILFGAAFIFPVYSDVADSSTLDSSFNISEERIVSDPISIVGNDDIIWSTLEGDGSEQNPYLIENLYIELNSSESWYEGVMIRDSTHSVIIRNCLIEGEYEWKEYGLHIQGTGIRVQNSSNIKITDNIIKMNYIGIDISASSDCKIEDNEIMGNDIENDDGYIARGIHIAESFSCDVQFNLIRNCSLGLEVIESDTCVISNNSITSCEQSAYTITLMKGTVSHNNFSYNSEAGLTIVRCNSTLFSRNTLNNNGNWGMQLGGSYHNTIIENIISENFEPIDSEYDTATGFGIFVLLDCENNTIEWNNFVNNVINSRCDSENNVFDYNYYSDYVGIDSNNDLVGDTPYDITGLGGIQDIHPRTSADAKPVIIDDSVPFEIILIGITSSVLVVIIVASIILKKR